MPPSSRFRDYFRLRRTRRPALQGDLAGGDARPDTAAQAQLAQLAEENEALREAYARQRGEFENFRRRTQREKEQAHDAAREDLFAKLLPILDNFERALLSSVNAADAQSVHKGISMIADQLSKLLESQGLVRLEAEGAVFDPAQHEAIAMIASDTVAENHVAEVLQPGYSFKDKVIRPAMVKVSKGTGGA